jgi:ribokinase
MSQFLRDVLTTDHPLFLINIQRLEKVAGESISVRLIADCRERAHAVMRSIGIDPADSRAKEVYHALRAAGKRQDAPQLFEKTAFVLLPFQDGPISFNLKDIIENAHHELPFEQRKYDSAQRHLRAEIVKRYADHDRTDNNIVKTLMKEAGVHTELGKHDILPPVGAAKPSLLAVGDIFTDAFIKLGDETAKVFKDDDGVEWLAVPYGRKPPYERVDIVKSVGPSPNAAVSCKRLGLDVSLMAWVGDDETGKEAIEYLQQQGIGTSDMVTEKGKLTSYWYVLSYKADRTMLIKSEEYQYQFTAPKNVPDWIYLSYTGKDSWPLHEQLLEYLEANPSIKLAFQPGTFQFNWGAEKLAGIYKRSYITIMNREEAMDVTGKGYDDLHELAAALHDLGPEIVVITDGPKGSYASYDGKMVTIPNYPDPGPPLDRTGAGDAFASTIVAGLALGKPMDEVLPWAPINSMSVVQKMGAQAGLLHTHEIAEYLKTAPENYKVTPL